MYNIDMAIDMKVYDQGGKIYMNIDSLEDTIIIVSSHTGLNCINSHF